MVAGVSRVGVHRLARDPIVAGRGVVTQGVAQPPADQAVRLNLMHQIEQEQALLVGDTFGGVKPEDGDRPVVRQQFAHLGRHIVADIAVEVLLGRGRSPNRCHHHQDDASLAFASSRNRI